MKKININGREITNPIAKSLIYVSALAIIFGILFIIAIVILGLMGLIAGFLTIVGVVTIAIILISIPLGLIGLAMNKKSISVKNASADKKE